MLKPLMLNLKLAVIPQQTRLQTLALEKTRRMVETPRFSSQIFSFTTLNLSVLARLTQLNQTNKDPSLSIHLLLEVLTCAIAKLVESKMNKNSNQRLSCHNPTAPRDPLMIMSCLSKASLTKN
jgi:hypothetical protein